ncbi:MAG: nucleotidyltransferase domain-containing protein [Deltaproteobacteria bacterium]
MNYSEILIDLKQSLYNKFNENVKDVILFGSQINEAAPPNSDFDILIIVNRNVNWKLEKQVSDICFDIELKYGIFLDVHILSKDEVEQPRGKQPIFENALKNGIYA